MIYWVGRSKLSNGHHLESIQHVHTDIFATWYSYSSSIVKTNAMVLFFTTTALMWPLCHIFTMAICALRHSVSFQPAIRNFLVFKKECGKKWRSICVCDVSVLSVITLKILAAVFLLVAFVCAQVTTRLCNLNKWKNEFKILTSFQFLNNSRH